MKSAVIFITAVYNAFVELDASIVEINPLVITSAGEMIALDAKMNFDDNALYRHSDIQAGDISVAQLYDAFTPLIPLSLEGYGFCGKGEGAAFTEDGALDLGGRLPINTSGGGLSEAYVHGFNLINEGVRQIRGESVNQVEGCESCLVTAGEAVPTSAMILRK